MPDHVRHDGFGYLVAGLIMLIIEDLYFGYRFFTILRLFFVSRNLVVLNSDFYSDYHNNVPIGVKEVYIF